jgi:hypothetical protein
MLNSSDTQLRFLLCWILLLSALAGGPRLARGAVGCPTTADAIATDRPDVTNSSLARNILEIRKAGGQTEPKLRFGFELGYSMCPAQRRSSTGSSAQFSTTSEGTKWLATLLGEYQGN